MGVTEVAAGTWRVESRLGDRDLFQYIVAADGEAMVIDAGITSTPRDEILPALRRVGIRRDGVRFVVITHCDMDHQGGLAAMRVALPAARLACGFADRGVVCHPRRLVTDRYGAWELEHGLAYSDSDKAWMIEQAGPATDVDMTFSGGERVGIGDRGLSILHAPGHSPGHLVVHEPPTGLVFTSDAVQGRMYPDQAGGAALPPTYEDVDDYLDTIGMVESLRPAALHSGHWPAREGPAVPEFLRESAAFVAAVDRTVIDRLSEPATLAQLCAHVDGRLGPFGADPINLVYAVHGHVRRLLRRGKALLMSPGERPPRFRLA